jgi:cytochrome c2
MTRALVILLLLGASIGAMTWAAVPPGHSPLRDALRPAGETLRGALAWFRQGPADGHPDWKDARRDLLYGDAGKGAELIKQYGCGACHEIPGVRGASGTVGPGLSGFAERAYIAGVMPNDPGSLTRWLVNPPVHSPQTAMPDLGITDDEAQHMAAYLMSLRGR